MKQKIKILIADDHMIVRVGLAALRIFAKASRAKNIK